MTKCKWVKFYPSDFLTGIRSLRQTEVTAYIIVLCELYDNEGMCPRNDAAMSDRCRMRQTVFTDALDGLIARGKISFYAGMLTNKRVSEEIENRLKAASEKAEQRLKRDLNGTQTELKQPGKRNVINGNRTHVRPYIEIREDKNLSSLEVSALHPKEALEERNPRSAAALAGLLKRREMYKRRVRS